MKTIPASPPVRLWSMHIIGWLSFIIFTLLFIHNGKSYRHFASPLGHPNYWLFLFAYVALFYTNLSLLIPRFFMPGKYGRYVLLAALLGTGIYFLQPFDRLLQSKWDLTPPAYRILPKEAYQPPAIDITSMFMFVMIMAMGIALTVTRRWQLTEQRALKAESEKVRAELSFLKAQVHPHFLFNTLNNLYTLAISNSTHTADSIMRLSNIMRYVTEEVTADEVPLQQEADCILDYIALQRLRLGAAQQIDNEILGDLLPHTVGPLLLLTFVENIFKYGISKHEPAPIFIRLCATRDTITFYCRNRIFPAHTSARSNGVGIANARQRLELLYPERHQLNIHQTDGCFIVNLTLRTTGLMKI